jgi:hypothetical protein
MLKHQVAGKKNDCIIINIKKYKFNGSSIKIRGSMSWEMFATEACKASAMLVILLVIVLYTYTVVP